MRNERVCEDIRKCPPFCILILQSYIQWSNSLFDGRRNDKSDPSSYLGRWDCLWLCSPVRARHVRPQVGHRSAALLTLFRAASSCRRRRRSSSFLSCGACVERRPVVQMSPQPLRSAANVSKLAGGIAFFVSVAFKQFLKRLYCPPEDLRPSFNSTYSTRRGSRFSGMRMTCPVHLSWRSAMMAPIERQWARWRISTWGTLSHQCSLGQLELWVRIENLAKRGPLANTRKKNLSNNGESGGG